MIDRITVDRIFAAADIVDVVGDFVTLRKRGINYQALCPFHNEKTPSFVVSPTKGLFKCFGCGKGGNAITFVMEHEGLSYPEALRYVAKKYGIEVEEREMSSEEARRQDDRESMMAVTSFAAEWFKEQLTKSEEGRAVGLSYIKERGFSSGITEKFGVGYCHEKNNEFSQAALKAGYKEEFLLSTGLSGESRTGGLYDRFYGRVLFPIHAVSGRVIAFGARTLRTDKNVAKYLNSPESELYHKSKVLYGLFHAKKAITQEDCCILVEGYTDVMSMFQSGVENVVATSGTALSSEQIRLIARFTRNVTMLFDGDQAGVKASMRGVDIILREGLNVRVVSLPEDEDPDSFAKKNNATQLREFIKNEQEDFISFKTRVLMKDAEGDPIKRAELINDIVESIAEVPDPIQRSVYVQETAKKMSMEREVLAGEVARKRISHGADKQTQEFIRNQRTQQRTQQRQEVQMARLRGITIGSSIEELEKELIKYLLKYGDLNFDYKEGKSIVSLNVAQIIINDIEANGLEFVNKNYRELYNCYIEHYREREERVAEMESDEKDEEGAEMGNDEKGEEGVEMESDKKGGKGKKGEIEIHYFVNHADPQVCNAAVDVLTDNENYVVSKMWEKFEIVVEGEVERLAEIVPRTVILYKSKAIEAIIESLQEKLRGDLTEEQISDVMFKITTLNKERMEISKRLSRLVL